MDAISLFAGLLALALGAALGYLVAMRKVAAQTAELAGEARAARERAALIDGHLAERYQVLSDLEARRAAVEHMVEPLRNRLARVETQLRAAHAALAEQVQIARRSTEQLRDQTQALVTALRRPEARGRWGEMQLRRVAELAGMSARCDFDEQVTVAGADGNLRPDMVIRLAGGKNIVVDSK